MVRPRTVDSSRFSLPQQRGPSSHMPISTGNNTRGSEISLETILPGLWLYDSTSLCNEWVNIAIPHRTSCLDGRSQLPIEEKWWTREFQTTIIKQLFENIHSFTQPRWKRKRIFPNKEGEVIEYRRALVPVYSSYIRMIHYSVARCQQIGNYRA